VAYSHSLVLDPAEVHGAHHHSPVHLRQVPEHAHVERVIPVRVGFGEEIELLHVAILCLKQQLCILHVSTINQLINQSHAGKVVCVMCTYYNPLVSGHREEQRALSKVGD
jgi:hypothetical protein